MIILYVSIYIKLFNSHEKYNFHHEDNRVRVGVFKPQSLTLSRSDYTPTPPLPSPQRHP